METVKWWLVFRGRDIYGPVMRSVKQGQRSGCVFSGIMIEIRYFGGIKQCKRMVILREFPPWVGNITTHVFPDSGGFKEDTEISLLDGWPRNGIWSGRKYRYGTS